MYDQAIGGRFIVLKRCRVVVFSTPQFACLRRRREDRLDFGEIRQFCRQMLNFAATLGRS